MMSSLFDDMYLVAVPLMTPSRLRSAEAGMPLDPYKLMDAVHTVRVFFDFIVAMPSEKISHFSSADWVHLIVACILAYRLSLPIEICPKFDTAQARNLFDFSSYLERLCVDPEKDALRAGGKKTDVFTAFRVVLGSLKAKFEKKVAASAAKEEIRRKAQECPMFDGSLDDYISIWDGHGVSLGSPSYPSSQSSSSGVLTNPVAEVSPVMDQTKPQVFTDLWSTMTMGWGAEDMTDYELGDTQLDYGGF